MAVRGRKRLEFGERAHAVCMLASEIADAMLYAVDGPPDETYSSPQRILGMYERLVQEDLCLEADNAERVEGDDEWCSVMACDGLDWHGKRSCKGPAGWCFGATIAHARKIGKTPLCAACVSYITARRRVIATPR